MSVRNRVCAGRRERIQLGREARVERRDRQAHVRDRQRQEDQRLERDPGGVLALDRIEHRPVPDVDAVLNREVHERDRHEEPGEPPRGGARSAPPEAERGLPEGGEEVLPGALLVGAHRQPLIATAPPAGTMNWARASGCAAGRAGAVAGWVWAMAAEVDIAAAIAIKVVVNACFKGPSPKLAL